MPNNLGYWQDQISLSDPAISGTPEMDCLRPNEANAEVVVPFCLLSLFAIDLKIKWIHMKQEQLSIQFCCQKEHMHVKKCQLTLEV